MFFMCFWVVLSWSAFVQKDPKTFFLNLGLFQPRIQWDTAVYARNRHHYYYYKINMDRELHITVAVLRVSGLGFKSSSIFFAFVFTGTGRASLSRSVMARLHGMVHVTIGLSKRFAAWLHGDITVPWMFNELIVTHWVTIPWETHSVYVRPKCSNCDGSALIRFDCDKTTKTTTTTVKSYFAVPVLFYINQFW